MINFFLGLFLVHLELKYNDLILLKILILYFKKYNSFVLKIKLIIIFKKNYN